MNKLIKAALATALIAVAPSAFAKTPVTVSLTNNFESGAPIISTTFYSTDWGDRTFTDRKGAHVNKSKNATIKHQYSHGPKNITFGIHIDHQSIISDKPLVNRCQYISNIKPKEGYIYSQTMRSSTGNMHMTFTVDKDNVLTCNLTQS